MDESCNLHYFWTIYDLYISYIVRSSLGIHQLSLWLWNGQKEYISLKIDYCVTSGHSRYFWNGKRNMPMLMGWSMIASNSDQVRQVWRCLIEPFFTDNRPFHWLQEMEHLPQQYQPFNVGCYYFRYIGSFLSTHNINCESGLIFRDVNVFLVSKTGEWL